MSDLLGASVRSGRGLLRQSRSLLSLGLVAVSMAACASGTTPPNTLNAPVSHKPVMLAINGFNYTDLTISSFSVNGAGGGNIFVSTPTTGGGGTACCVVFVSGASLPQPLNVEWVRWTDAHHNITCHKTVMLNGPIPAHPTALGVHFMPDGNVEVEVTDGYPKVRLHLGSYNGGHRHATGNVIHDREMAECTDGGD
jgi:hypothetical protein